MVQYATKISFLATTLWALVWAQGRTLEMVVTRHWPFIALVAAAFLTRFWGLGRPPEVVFDEVHFGKFVSGYFTGEYFFDIHPPFGKLFIAASGWIGGFDGSFTFSNIHQPYGDTPYIFLRAVPALFGAMLVPLTYLLMRQMDGSKLASCIAAGLVLLDNALLIESRFILVDTILLFFGFLSLLFFLVAMRHRTASKTWMIFLPLTGIALGATVSTKWTGVGMLGLVGLVALIDLAKSAWGSNRQFIRKLIGYAICLVGIPAFVYFGIWLLHFELLPNSGPGDVFMTPEFRVSLNGSQGSMGDHLSSYDKVLELNRTMYRSNSGIQAEHPWQSQWWSWPFIPRGISFWESRTDSNVARVYLLGVPYLWWLVSMGSITFIYMALCRFNRPRNMGGERRRLFCGYNGHILIGTLLLLLGGITILVQSSMVDLGRVHYAAYGATVLGSMATLSGLLRHYGRFGAVNSGFLRNGVLTYSFMSQKDQAFLKYGGLLTMGLFANWLPFSLIDRPLFLYHYFFSFIFSILISALVFDNLWTSFGHMLRVRVIVGGTILLLVLGFFLFIPISYGYDLPSSLERIWYWFPDWQQAI